MTVIISPESLELTSALVTPNLIISASVTDMVLPLTASLSTIKYSSTLVTDEYTANLEVK